MVSKKSKKKRKVRKKSKNKKKNIFFHGSHRLEKYLNSEGFFEKSLKIKYAIKSTGKSLKGLEKCLNSSFFSV